MKSITQKIEHLQKKISMLDQHLITDFFKVISPEQNSLHAASSSSSSFSNLSIDSSKEELTQELFLLETELSNLTEILIRQSMFKVKNCQLAHLEKEKPTKFFFAMEKKVGLNSQIKVLKLKDGTISHDDQEIISEFKYYYKNLFNSSPSLPDTLSSSTHSLDFLPFVDQISDEEKDLVNAPFTMEELEEVFLQIKEKRNASPGLDGLTFNFYLMLKDLLAPFLLNMFNFMLTSNFCPFSFKQSVIKLIPKEIKEGDTHETKDFRPISLSNCDFKIFSKMINNRLISLSDSIISQNQTGLPGRSIFSNILFMKDVLSESIPVFPSQGSYSASSSFSSGLAPPYNVFSIDFTKAYDTVNREFVFNLLQKANFGNMARIIKNNLFVGTQTQICCNGLISPAFSTTSGLKQGDPSSPWLFCLTVQPLLKLLHEKFGLLSTAYLDDIAIFFNNVHHVQEILVALEHFGIASGLKINIKKSGILLSKSNLNNVILISQLFNDRNDKVPPLIHNFLYLGCPISSSPSISDTNVFIQNYWKERFDKSVSILNQWKKHHNLSLKGKVLVWNALIVSRFIHAGLIFSVPNGVIKDLDSLLKDFLWSDKTHCLSLDKLALPFDQGGLNLIILTDHLKTLKISFLKKLLSLPSSDLSLHSHLAHMTFQLLHKSLFSSSSLSSKSPQSFTSLYKEAKNKFGPVNSRVRSLAPPSNFFIPTKLPDFYASLWTALASLSPLFTKWPEDNKDTRFALILNRIKVPLTDYYKDISPLNDIQRARVFRNLWKNEAPPIQNQFFYLFLHRALPLNDRLHRHNISSCPFCHSQVTPLSHNHLFLECRKTKELLANALHLLSPRLIISPSSLLFFIFSGGKVKNKRIQNSKLIILHRKWFYLIWISFISSLSPSPSSSSPSPSLSFILSTFVFSL